MATNTISQLKIDNTIYDINDNIARLNLTFFDKRECFFNDDVTWAHIMMTTKSWDSYGNFVNNRYSSNTNRLFIGYVDFGITSTDLYVCNCSNMNQISIWNNNQYTDIVAKPTATQLWVRFCNSF